MYHKNPIFTINNKYKSVIAATPTELNEQSSCGLVYDFQLDPKARLLVNGVSMSSLESDDICADQYNRIGIELYGTQNGLTQVVPGSCAADWLEGHEEDYTGEGCYATYNYQNIINAISTFRTYYPSNRNLDNCTAIDGFTNQQLELLNELVTRRMLELYKYEIERRVAVGTIYFTALPISNSAVAPDGTTKLSVCEMPIVVKLSTKQDNMQFNCRI